MILERWQKMIKASDGTEILYFMLPDILHDDSQELTCVVRFNDRSVTVHMLGIPDKTAQKFFDEICASTADATLKMVIQLDEVKAKQETGMHHAAPNIH